MTRRSVATAYLVLARWRGVVRTRAAQVRLAIGQHERLRAIATARGFDTIAGYLRFAALDRQEAKEIVAEKGNGKREPRSPP